MQLVQVVVVVEEGSEVGSAAQLEAEEGLEVVARTTNVWAPLTLHTMIHFRCTFFSCVVIEDQPARV